MSAVGWGRYLAAFRGSAFTEQGTLKPWRSRPELTSVSSAAWSSPCHHPGGRRHRPGKQGSGIDKNLEGGDSDSRPGFAPWK